MELISNYIDKGVTFVLSLLVILFLFMMIKHLPKWIKDYTEAISHSAISTDNNTRVMTEVTKVIQNTEKMHEKMDLKMEEQHEDVDNRISEVLGQIVALQNIVETQGKADEDFRKILSKEIEKLKDEVKILNMYQKGEVK